MRERGKDVAIPGPCRGPRLSLGDLPSPIRRDGWVFEQGVIENHSLGVNYIDISVIVGLPVKIVI